MLKVILPVTFIIVILLWKLTSTIPPKMATGNDLHDIHIVVSTGCSPSQNWQAETLLYSWKKINHPGKITRIVSGCENEEQKEVAKRTAISEANIHFTPDYCYMDKFVMKEEYSGKQAYCHLWNKPMGTWHWLNNTDIQESVVVLLDPDQIIVQEFKTQLKSSEDEFVQEGRPTHNRYGYGCEWKKYCTLPHCKEMSCGDAHDKFTVGPPYMMHINDWKKHTPLWHAYTYSTRPLDYADHGIMFEMFSFSLANLHLNLKTTVVEYMLSNIHANEHGWKEMYDSDLTIESPPTKMFHYCSGYYVNPIETSSPRQGGFNFHKGHVPEKILTQCEMPLLAEAPIGKTAHERDTHEKKRNVFMQHWVIKYINLAVVNYRTRFCAPGWNDSKVIFMHQPDYNPGYFYIPGETERKYHKQGLVPWSDHNPPYDEETRQK